ncbi:MAG: hypothetical protein K0U20_08620 [Proteobacteria bacterium]|nr:hypothetical protein [Pseudomonadota bacterium]
MVIKSKAMTGAERTAKSNAKRKAAGLIQIKIWVADPRNEVSALNGVKTEADKVRAYASKQPKTKALLESIE